MRPKTAKSCFSELCFYNAWFNIKISQKSHLNPLSGRMRVVACANETFRLILDVKMSNLREILENECQLRKQENFDDEERKVDDRLVLGKSLILSLIRPVTIIKLKRISEKYEIGAALGGGGYGRVHYLKAKRSSEHTELRKIGKFIQKDKIIKWTKENGKEIPLEVHICRTMAHANIMKCIDYVDADENWFLMVMRDSAGFYLTNSYLA